MGAFYGSINIHTPDVEAVRAAATKVFRKFKRRCYLSPCIDGWVSVYPQKYGQDDKPAEWLAAELKGDVLQFIVHDDDVFVLNCWSDGKEGICFMSTPGYFDEDQYEHELKAYPGDAAQFKGLIGAKVAPLAELLKPTRKDEECSFTFESDRLKKVAALFEISNALTAYEYLEQGEVKGIKQWKAFVKIPDEKKN